MFRALAVWLLAAFAVSCPLPASAQPANVSAGEIALLPTYCRDRNWTGGNDGDPERRAMWRARMGVSWDGLHHYCWGLIHVSRATLGRVSAQQRAHMIDVAISDYEYVIRFSTRDFVLLPEIFLRLGEAHALNGRLANAINAFREAREIKPDYWPAYLREADAMLQVKMPMQRVRDLLVAGLVASPNQPDLAKRLRELGGDPSKVPQPAPAAPAAPAASAPTPSPAAAEPPAAPASAA